MEPTTPGLLLKPDRISPSVETLRGLLHR